MKLNFFEKVLNAFFQKLGRIVGKRPWAFILLPIVLVLLLVLVLSRGIGGPDDPLLFIPENAMHLKEKAVMDANFYRNYSSGFDAGRALTIKNYGRVTLINNQNSSILTVDNFEKLLYINTLIQNINITVNNQTLVYQDICAKSVAQTCHPNWILNLKPYISRIEQGTYKVRYPLHITQNIKYVFLGTNIGGVEIDNENYITFAKGFSLIYILNPTDQEVGSIWEKEFLRIISNQRVEGMTIAYYTSQSLRGEIKASAYKTMPLFLTSFVVIIVFGMISFSSLDWVKSKSWLVILGTAGIMLAVLGSMHFCAVIGIPFINNNFVIFFFMLVLGLNDIYSMISSWNGTERKYLVEHRMGETYIRSCTTSSIINIMIIVAFASARRVPIPGFKILCLYSIVALIFVFIFKITFFGGVLALAGQAEQNNRHGITCFRVRPKTKAKTKLSSLFCGGGLDPSDPENVKDNKYDFLSTSLADLVLSITSYLSGKLIILAIFWICLGFGIYGCTQLKENLDPKSLVDSNTYVYKFNYYQQQYFSKYPLRMQVVINQPLNYSDPIVQGQIQQVITKLEAVPQISDSILTENWLSLYAKYFQGLKFMLKFQGYRVEEESGFVKVLRERFFNLKLFKRFQNDVNYNEDGTEIVSSRILLQIYQLQTPSDYINLLTQARKIVNEAPFKMVIYNPFFGFMEQVLVIKTSTIQALCLSMLIILVLNCVFNPKLINIVVSMFILISSVVTTIGMMALWGVQLDFITMICIFISEAISISSTFHVVWAYEHSKFKQPLKKIGESLNYSVPTIGTSCLAATIGITALALSTVAVFVNFFKVLFITSIVCFFYNVLVLPTFLQVNTLFWSSVLRKNESIQSERGQTLNELVRNKA